MDFVTYANQGATRRLPLSGDLVEALSFLPELGVRAEVFSGGQPAIGSGAPRVGSTRHDHGNAADVFFYQGDRRLDWNNPDDLPIFQDIVRRGRQAGLTGFGAGDGYMQPGSMHIGFGTPAVWGAGGRGANAPDWLRDTYYSAGEAGARPDVVTAATDALYGPEQGPNQPSAPAGRTDSTISTRGPEPMQEYEPEKAGGILGMLFPKMTADRQDSIALALSGLGRGNPALEANLRDRMGGRRDDRKEFEQQQQQRAQVNKTRDFVLRQVQNGNLPPVFAEMAQADPVGAFQAATQRLTAGEQPTYQQVRGSDLGLTGPQADMMFNRAPDGKITQVGGGGTVVNNNMGGGKFEEAFAKGDADTIGSVYNTGLQASRNMARIGELDTLLQSAPSGAEGALKLAAGQIGINTEGLGELQAAQAIINSLVPEQRQPGSGPMSDADLNLFKQSLPRIINQPGGNAMIIGTMQRIAEYDMQGAQIVQALRSGEIDRAEAFQRLQSRADPLGDVRGSFGSGGQDSAAGAPTDAGDGIPTFNPETGAWE